MKSFEEVLIAVGILTFTAVFITSLFPAHEGFAPPQCSDCLFKVNWGRLVQREDGAVLYHGLREVAKYGWAFLHGEPLSVGDEVVCDVMYVYVIGGMAYVTCGGDRP